MPGDRIPRPSTCRTCGKPITQANKGRPRLYCSDECRHVPVEEKRRKRCAVEGCDASPMARGMCSPHYWAAKNRGEFGRLCEVEGCTRAHWAHGLCSMHGRQAKSR